MVLDLRTMGGKCIPQTLAMEDFMMQEATKPRKGFDAYPHGRRA